MASPSNDLAPALVVRDLHKRFDDVIAVNGLDLEVRAGECFGLLGPNGAGKTTTIEICEGLTGPDSGDVIVLGQRWNSGARALRERLGIQLQETQLSEKLTVQETVELFRSFYKRGRSVDDVIALVQLDEKRSARVATLSGGQKQRLALACALAGDPELLFLDEPTTGLDPQSRRQLWDLVESLKAGGCTIVLTTHYMDEAQQLCDRIAIVDHGKVIALGTPRELIQRYCADQVVFFAVNGELSDEAIAPMLASIGQSAGTTATPRPADGGWEMQVAAPHEAIPALLAELARRDIQLAELRTHSPTLEDVFVTLTGRALRDA